MSEVRLLIREAARDWSGTVHGGVADRAIASLSADPVTFAELRRAAARFARADSVDASFSQLSPGVCDEPHDAGLVVIDMAARLVAVDSTYSSPGPAGEVSYHDGRCATNTYLEYHVADDWLFVRDRHTWEAAAENRRAQANDRALDVRAVFYGRPMLECIARQAFAAFARRDAIAAAVRAEQAESADQTSAREADTPTDEFDPDQLTDEEIIAQPWPGEERYASPFYDTLKEIHAAWLLAPRDDLGGKCPRDVALARHEHLSRDLEDRCAQWTWLGECPSGLDESSHAFRYGGFGTHEWVMYYELVRELTWSCWERLTELCDAPRASGRPEALAVGDFLASEVPRLEQFRDDWLDTPQQKFDGRTPRSIIARERARLPEGMCGHDAMIDPDCPCCQMMSELPGPVFWHLDGSGMDEEFAFNLFCLTREEWEHQQREAEEQHRRFDAEWKERERLGIAGFTPDASAPSIWAASYCVDDKVELPLGALVFGIGCRLAELVVDLRDQSDDGSPHRAAGHLIDQLNRDFGNLREVLQTSESSLGEALIQPLLDRFAETLAEVALARPDLTAQCESLAGTLARLLDEPPPGEESADPDPPY